MGVINEDLAGRARQAAIYRAGAFGRRPSVPTDFAELERQARKRMSKRAWAYVAGGAGSGSTMAANRAGFARHAIVPRMLRDVAQRDLRVELFGQVLPAPVLLSPIGAAQLVHPDADLATGRAAAALGLPYIFTNQGCSPMEDVAAVMDIVRPGAPRWFQLYWSADDGLVDSLLRRAEAVSATAVVVTLDTTYLGWRPQDLNLGSLPFARGEGIAQYTSDPRFREIVRDRVRAGAPGPAERPTLGALRTAFAQARNMPGQWLANLRSPKTRAAVDTFLDIYSRPTLNWNDIATLRERTTLPIVLKGVLHPDDARQAVDHGVDGLIVSNHGGRQVDGAIAAIAALPAVASAVDGRCKVLLDSGIRGGADIYKTLALGADAVCVGRPCVYGLAVAGVRGVTEVLANLVAEFDLTLALTGFRSPGELSPAALTASER